MLQYVKSPITVKTYLSYSVIDIYYVDINASNHVSNISKNFTLEVVRKSIHKPQCMKTIMLCLLIGTNTTLLLEFSVVALSQANVSYETTSWRKQFSNMIDTSLTNVRMSITII